MTKPHNVPIEKYKQDVAVHMYVVQQLATPSIAKKLQISKPSVLNILKRNNIQRRNRRFYNKRINEYAFDDPELSDAAYWIGFMMADGNVNIRRRSKNYIEKRLSLSLHIRDIDHVYKLRNFLQSEHTVSTIQCNTSFGPSTTARLMITNDHLVETLIKCGVTPNKSKTVSPHTKLVNNRHFWRGVIDGDGSIQVRTNDPYVFPIINLVGSQAMCSAFETYAKQHIGINSKASVLKHRTIYSISFSGAGAYTVIKSLYQARAHEVSLYRKQEKAQHILESMRGKYELSSNI